MFSVRTLIVPAITGTVVHQNRGLYCEWIDMTIPSLIKNIYQMAQRVNLIFRHRYDLLFFGRQFVRSLGRCSGKSAVDDIRRDENDQVLLFAAFI